MLGALTGKALNVTEICKIVGLSQSATSQHLARLRGADWSRSGGAQVVFYRCVSQEVYVLLDALRNVFRSADGNELIFEFRRLADL